jgi:hypothetical protein
MRQITLCIVGAGIILGAALPLYAHHSFAAEFDENKAVTLTGAVTKLEWMNPHIWVYLEEGQAEQWQCEGGPPNTLTRNGWTQSSLKHGDEITIQGYLAKDASNTCNMRLVKLADGRSVFAGSSVGNAATQPKK